MTFKELRRLPRDLYDRGVEVISTEDLRWKRCDIKTIALLPNILAKQAATQAGVFEALLVDAEGRVTEGASTSALSRTGGAIVHRAYWSPHSCRASPEEFYSTWLASSAYPSTKSFARWSNLRKPMRSLLPVLRLRRCQW